MFIVLFSMAISTSNYAQFVFFGPMLHYNIGVKTKNHFSFGLEASLWGKSTTPLSVTSIDCGVEFERDKVRLYSELQVGLLVGASIGYVQEFYDGESKGGIQGSIWGAFFGGVDMRYRYVGGFHYFAPGLFLKYPVMMDNGIKGN